MSHSAYRIGGSESQSNPNRRYLPLAVPSTYPSPSPIHPHPQPQQYPPPPHTNNYLSSSPAPSVPDHTLKPSAVKAQRYRDLTCPRQRTTDGHYQYFSIRDFTDSDFKVYGLGTLLYFKLVRRLSYLFLVMFLFSIPSFFFNVVGSGGGSNAYFLDRTTLGDQGIYTNLTIAGQTKSAIGAITTGCDLGYTLIFLIFLLVIHFDTQKEIRSYRASVLTVSRYTIAVHNLPSQSPTLTRTSLRQFFSSYGEVVDVCIAYDNFALIDLYRHRGEYKQQLAAAESRDDADQVMSLRRKIAEIDIDIEQESRGWRDVHESRPDRMDRRLIKPVCAYVTFVQQDTVDAVLNDYPDSFWFKLFMPFDLRFQGAKITVRPAPEPSNILYAHLGYSTCNKRMRRIFTFLVTIVLITISTVVVYVAQYYQQRIPAATECLSDIPINYSPTLTSNEIFCWCQSLSSTALLDSSSECSSYIAAYARRTGLIFVTSVTTVIMNSFIKFFVSLISRYEKHSSRSSHQKGIAKKLAIGLFLNTGIIIMVVNANLQPLVGQIGIKVVLDGAYTDFVSEWFSVVGVSIITTMLINTWNPHALNVFLVAWDWYKRRTYWKTAATQEELNALYAGRTFELDARYAIILCNIFVTMMYASGMPILLLICSATLFLTYWCDKYNFLRLYKSPARFDESLDSMTTQALPFAAFLHLAFAMWFYSSPCTDSFKISSFIFYASSSNDYNENSLGFNFSDRIFRWNVFPIGIFLVLLLLFFSFKGLFSVCCCRISCCRSTSSSFQASLSTGAVRLANSSSSKPSPGSMYSDKTDSPPTFYEACAKVRLESYRLSHQPNYQAAFLQTVSHNQLPPDRDFSDLKSELEKARRMRMMRESGSAAPENGEKKGKGMDKKKVSLVETGEGRGGGGGGAGGRGKEGYEKHSRRMSLPVSFSTSSATTAATIAVAHTASSRSSLLTAAPAHALSNTKSPPIVAIPANTNHSLIKASPVPAGRRASTTAISSSPLSSSSSSLPRKPIQHPRHRSVVSATINLHHNKNGENLPHHHPHSMSSTLGSVQEEKGKKVHQRNRTTLVLTDQFHPLPNQANAETEAAERMELELARFKNFSSSAPAAAAPATGAADGRPSSPPPPPYSASCDLSFPSLASSALVSDSSLSFPSSSSPPPPHVSSAEFSCPPPRVVEHSAAVHAASALILGLENGGMGGRGGGEEEEVKEETTAADETEKPETEEGGQKKEEGDAAAPAAVEAVVDSSLTPSSPSLVPDSSEAPLLPSSVTNPSVSSSPPTVSEQQQGVLIEPSAPSEQELDARDAMIAAQLAVREDEGLYEHDELTYQKSQRPLSYERCGTDDDGTVLAAPPVPVAAGSAAGAGAGTGTGAGTGVSASGFDSISSSESPPLVHGGSGAPHRLESKLKLTCANCNLTMTVIDIGEPANYQCPHCDYAFVM